MLGAPAAVALALRRALVTAAANTASRSSSVLTTTPAPTAAAAAAAAVAAMAAPPLLWSRRPLSSSSSSPTSPSTPTTPTADAAAAEAEARLRLANKLVYRAKQRGFLELDLLVGLWAERAIPRMASAPEEEEGGPPSPERARRALLDAQDLLDAENPDLFKWLTGQEAAPERMARNSAFADLHAHVQGQMREHAHPAARAARGAAWARGWDDYNSSSSSSSDGAGADGGGKEADGGGKEKEGAVGKGP